MSTTTTWQVANTRTSAPRGSLFAARAALALINGVTLLRQRLLGQPLDKARRAIAEAARVRGIATAMQAENPRVAAELMAAADRHERQNGV